MSDSNDQVELRPGAVFVLGGGIAGLTAAHELAERRFDVRLYDSAIDGRTISDVQTGGMAITQFVGAPVFTTNNVTHLGPGGRCLGSPVTLWKGEENKNNRLRGGRWPRILLKGKAPPKDLLERVAANMLEWVGGLVVPEGAKIKVFMGVIAPNEADTQHKLVIQAVKFFQGLLSHDAGSLSKLQLDKRRPEYLGSASEVLTERDLSRTEKDKGGAAPDHPYLVIAVHELLVPGEHGYRFFPGFYSHVFDTMKRTPLPGQPSAKTIESELRATFPAYFDPEPDRQAGLDTVFDHLISVERHAFATRRGHYPSVLPRTLRSSWEEMAGIADALQLELGVTGDDFLRGQLAAFRYLSSCTARREQYERTNWQDFSRADQGSEAYQKALTHWPQALVGLRADLADARTFGSVTMQLLLSHVRDEPVIDGTLDGPTSERWIDPWVAHMKKLDANFMARRVSELSFVVSNGKPKVRATIRRPASSDDDRHVSASMGDDPDGVHSFHVVALPHLEVARLGIGLRDSIAALPVDMQDAVRTEFARSPVRLALEIVLDGLSSVRASSERPSSWETLSMADVEDYTERVRKNGDPEGTLPYRHFAGIQFFLAQDFPILKGHIYYPDSAWRLSSISQGQFRQARGERNAYRGVISVIIGAWNARDERCPKTAWSCGEHEIAAEVWRQLREGLGSASRELPEQVPDFSIDQNIKFGTTNGKRQVTENSSPYLVNTVRLADLWRRFASVEYRAWFYGSMVFCGSWLPTSTRIATMEAANESARRAVNALLASRERKSKTGFVTSPCALFEMEAREAIDLAFLRRLDAELVSRGLPHVLDVLGVPALLLDDMGSGRHAADHTHGLRAIAQSGDALLQQILKKFRLGG